MALSKLHIAGALTGAAALAAAAIGAGGVAVAAPGAAGTAGMVATQAVSVSAASAGVVSSRAQGARLAGAVAPQQAPLHGSTPAPATDRRQISRAVTHSPLTSAVDPDDYRVNTIRLSRTNPAWAAAMIRPTVPLDPAAVLAHRVHGHWKVVTLGTAQVGCGLTPQGVLQDFRSYDSIGHCQ